MVGSWDGRDLRLTEVYRFPNQFRSIGGHDYWDLPGLWRETRIGLARARSLFPRLASVGVDGWAVDYVLIGPDGRRVHPVHAYRDSRTLRGSERLGRNGIRRIYALTGVPNYSYNTSLQLAESIEACPGLENLDLRCLFIPDYFNFLLSGRRVNELSIASHSQLLDVHGRGWSAEALRHFGIPGRWFGKPVRSPRKLGPVVRGLPELRGVLSVLVPGHDTACAFMGMPARPDGSDLYLSSGTWSLLGIESNAPVLGDAALRARISNERMGDGGYRPLKSCLGLWIVEGLMKGLPSPPRGARSWSTLVAEAGGRPAPAHLLDLKDKALFNPPSMKAAVDGQLRRLGCRVPADLTGYVGLVCRSIARGHADAVRDLEKLSGRRFGRVLMVGGGSRNRLLCQATADAAGIPVASYALEGAVVGNLASQLIALGEVSDLAAFRERLRESLRATVYDPR